MKKHLELYEAIEASAGSLDGTLNNGFNGDFPTIVPKHIHYLYRWRNGYSTGNKYAERGAKSIPPMQAFLEMETAIETYEMHYLLKDRVGPYDINDLFPIFAGGVQCYTPLDMIKPRKYNKEEIVCYFIEERSVILSFPNLEGYFGFWLELIKENIIEVEGDLSGWRVSKSKKFSNKIDCYTITNGLK